MPPFAVAWARRELNLVRAEEAFVADKRELGALREGRVAMFTQQGSWERVTGSQDRDILKQRQICRGLASAARPTLVACNLSGLGRLPLASLLVVPLLLSIPIVLDAGASFSLCFGLPTFGLFVGHSSSMRTVPTL